MTSKRILITEDNEQNLYLSRFLLEQAGYEIIVARTGVQAIVSAQTEKPDLILMDIQMPEMDGYEAIQKLLSHPDTKSIPIVAVSSYAMVGDRNKALDMGCAGYIEKPIVPETFVAQIGAFIEKYV